MMLLMRVSYVHTRTCKVEWAYSCPNQFYIQFSNRKQWTPQAKCDDAFLNMKKKKNINGLKKNLFNSKVTKLTVP